MAVPGAFDHGLYHYGVERHLLRVLAIIVEGQMPDARIQVLDEACLVHTHRPCLPTTSLRLQQVSLLSSNQPAAVQKFHEVILSMGRW